MKNLIIGFAIGAAIAYIIKPKKRKKEIEPV